MKGFDINKFLKTISRARTGEPVKMFAVGHVAFEYITGISSVKPLKGGNIPVIWTLSLLPDIDFLIPGLQHRGPTRSLIFLKHSHIIEDQ